MKLRILLASCLMLHASTGLTALTIEDFGQYPAGQFPSSWRTWPFQRGKAEKVYSVNNENNNKYLAALDSQDISVQILKNFHWKIEHYPVLSWRWRAKVLPAGANETDPATNDSACGVYVVFSRARGEMIKYTWSTTAPIGTAYEKKSGKAYIVALDGGPGKIGTWKSHKINVTEEYQKYFNRPLDYKPAAIAVLTDGNATHTIAACDYDDFEIRGESE